MIARSVLALLLLAACATAPRPEVSAFEVGMDREAVLALGAPQRAETDGSVETLTYDARNEAGERRRVTVTLMDGRVIEVADAEPPRATTNRDRTGDTGSRL